MEDLQKMNDHEAGDLSIGPREVVLVRHGETEWSERGRHTSRTDLPLTVAGEDAATRLRSRLARCEFELVLTSPAQRARETCQLAGLGTSAQTDTDLAEWDYGDYEGRTTVEIREQLDRPDWTVWNSGPMPNGESLDDVGRRVDRVIARVIAAKGAVVLFGHGHGLRVLAARWLELDPGVGARVALHTGTLSVLGYERETRVLQRWNT